MLGINRELEKLEKSGRQIKVGLVGAGQMGRGMISQITSMNGMKVVATSDIQIDNVTRAYELAGVPSEEVMIADDLREAEEAVKVNKSVAMTDSDLLCQVDGIDVIVDRKSTRLNSSHVAISYAVFCFKNK